MKIGEVCGLVCIVLETSRAKNETHQNSDVKTIRKQSVFAQGGTGATLNDVNTCFIGEFKEFVFPLSLLDSQASLVFGVIPFISFN